jgi:hypothetical protein
VRRNDTKTSSGDTQMKYNLRCVLFGHNFSAEKGFLGMATGYAEPTRCRRCHLSKLGIQAVSALEVN